MSIEIRHVMEMFSSNDVHRAKWRIYAMTKSCEFNLREQSSLHRKLRTYGKDEVMYIKAPNRNINRVQDNQNILKAKFALLVLIFFISLNYPCGIIYSMRIGGLVVK